MSLFGDIVQGASTYVKGGEESKKERSDVVCGNDQVAFLGNDNAWFADV